MATWREPESIRSFKGWAFIYRKGEDSLYKVEICFSNASNMKFLEQEGTILAWMPVEFPYPPCEKLSKAGKSRIQLILGEKHDS